MAKQIAGNRDAAPGSVSGDRTVCGCRVARCSPPPGAAFQIQIPDQLMQIIRMQTQQLRGIVVEVARLIERPPDDFVLRRFEGPRIEPLTVPVWEG